VQAGANRPEGIFRIDLFRPASPAADPAGVSRSDARQVVGVQKKVGDALTEIEIDPLLEIRRHLTAALRQALKATLLVFARQPVNIALERIGNPSFAQQDPGFAQQMVPFLHDSIQKLVEVLIVLEGHMHAHIPGESLLVRDR
jgi:hypothetical protein